MKVFVNNLPDFEEEIRRAAFMVMEEENLGGELDITFVDDEKIRELNRKYKGIDEVTDVLAFQFNIPSLLGDIYISLSRAEEQKEGDLISELKLLTVHGILHLAGYDDDREEERKRMKDKEFHYLKKLSD